MPKLTRSYGSAVAVAACAELKNVRKQKLRVRITWSCTSGGAAFVLPSGSRSVFARMTNVIVNSLTLFCLEVNLGSHWKISFFDRNDGIMAIIHFSWKTNQFTQTFSCGEKPSLVERSWFRFPWSFRWGFACFFEVLLLCLALCQVLRPVNSQRFSQSPISGNFKKELSSEDSERFWTHESMNHELIDVWWIWMTSALTRISAKFIFLTLESSMTSRSQPLCRNIASCRVLPGCDACFRCQRVCGWFLRAVFLWKVSSMLCSTECWESRWKALLNFFA